MSEIPATRELGETAVSFWKRRAAALEAEVERLKEELEEVTNDVGHWRAIAKSRRAQRDRLREMVTVFVDWIEPMADSEGRQHISTIRAALSEASDE